MANAVVELGAWALGRRRRLRVSGRSMEPTLSDGEYILVHAKSQVKVGSMVVASHPHSGAEIVKRVQSIGPSGVWLLSDNPAEGSDSRRFGAVDKGSLSGVVSLILSRPVNSL